MFIKSASDARLFIGTTTHSSEPTANMSYYARRQTAAISNQAARADALSPPMLPTPSRRSAGRRRQTCLAAASWDGKVRIYNVANSSAISAVALLAAEGPVLSCDFSKVSLI